MAIQDRYLQSQGQVHKVTYSCHVVAMEMNGDQEQHFTKRAITGNLSEKNKKCT